MKVLIEATAEVGQRTVRALLSHSDVEYVGIWRAQDDRSTARSGPARTVDGYDIAVTDSTRSHTELVARCSVAGIPIVMWSDSVDIAPGAAVVPVVVGANVGSALPSALLAHPTARPDADEPVQVAWTEPGSPIRRGRSIVFPDPIGKVRARRRGKGSWVARRSDEWAGAVVQVGDRDSVRIVGVADHAAYLEALVLSAAVLAVAKGEFEPGVHRAGDAGERMLNALARVELDIAAWRSHT